MLLMLRQLQVLLHLSMAASVDRACARENSTGCYA
jgi:hypothetical protein